MHYSVVSGQSSLAIVTSKMAFLFCFTLTCSLEVTAQNTISVKPCVGNIRKQIPPITLLSLMSARHLCFLKNSDSSSSFL